MPHFPPCMLTANHYSQPGAVLIHSLYVSLLDIGEEDSLSGVVHRQTNDVLDRCSVHDGLDGVLVAGVCRVQALDDVALRVQKENVVLCRFVK